MKRKLIQLALFLIFATTSSHAYYQTEQGRWLNRDPIREYGGINLYGFVDNNSVTLIDYFGLQFGAGGGFWEASPEQIRNMRTQCNALNKVTDKLGRSCYKCTIQRDTASKKDVSDALVNGSGNDILVQGHGDSERNRYLKGSVPFNDNDMHNLAGGNGNKCTTYGCYADGNPKSKTTEAAAYRKMLDTLKSYDQKPDCCNKVKNITLLFGPKVAYF